MAPTRVKITFFSNANEFFFLSSFRRIRGYQGPYPYIWKIESNFRRWRECPKVIWLIRNTMRSSTKFLDGMITWVKLAENATSSIFWKALRPLQKSLPAVTHLSRFHTFYLISSRRKGWTEVNDVCSYGKACWRDLEIFQKITTNSDIAKKQIDQWIMTFWPQISKSMSSCR